MERKHQSQFQDNSAERPQKTNDYHEGGQRQPKSKETRQRSDSDNRRGSSMNRDRDSSNENYRSKDKLSRDKSNDDLSASSQSKMKQTHKRQWKAPNTHKETNKFNL